MSIHTRSNQYGKILGDWHIRKRLEKDLGKQLYIRYLGKMPIGKKSVP